MFATAVSQHILFFLLVSNGSSGESLPIPALNPFYKGFFKTVVVATHPDQRNVTVFLDWGYWTPSLVYWLVACGAFVVETLIRAVFRPMTYYQEKNDGDKQMFLETKDAQILLIKQLQTTSTHNQLLTSGAFHNGTKNISLTLSSKHHENQWDCIFFMKMVS